MKKILITGGAGYIGSHITEVLLKKKLKYVLLTTCLQDLKD